MKSIGITGGIGMGKTACSDWFRKDDLMVVDSDEISRDLTRSDPGVLGGIRDKFGDAVFDSESVLDRAALAKIVFLDPVQRRVLESILHPRIREAWQSQIRHWGHEGHRMGFVVIPLLFETRAEECFDAIICVACSARTQTERLRKRGWNPDQIEKRIASQLPVKDKMARSDHVIWTEGTMESTHEQLKMVLRQLA